MSFTPAQLQTLIGRCEQFRDAVAPEGYPGSLALCVVDSVQSTGVRYASVVKVVTNYREYRRSWGADPSTDGVPELLQTFDELGGPEAWAAKIGNQNKTSTRANAPLKAQAIRDAAAALTKVHITTTGDLRAKARHPYELLEVESAWRAVVAQRSGITWHYMQMLAGLPGIKPDRMIMRFVADALEVPRARMSPSFALAILSEAALQMGISPTDLDHGIWQWQRIRR